MLKCVLRVQIKTHMYILTDNLNILQYSNTLFNASCNSISFSANIIASSAYSNTYNFNIFTIH